MWAAMPAVTHSWALHGLNPDHREELRCQARKHLGPGPARAAEGRGAAMSLPTATEYAILLAAEPVRPSGNGAPRRPGGRDGSWRG